MEKAGPAMPSPKKSNLGSSRGTPRMTPKKTVEEPVLQKRPNPPAEDSQKTQKPDQVDLDATMKEEQTEETGKQSEQQGDKPGNGKDDAEGKKTETSELETETQTQTQSVETAIDFATIGRLVLTAGEMDIVCGGRLADNVNGNVSCYLGITPQTQQSKKGFQG